jgi:hypothetical protein
MKPDEARSAHHALRFSREDEIQQEIRKVAASAVAAYDFTKIVTTVVCPWIDPRHRLEVGEDISPEGPTWCDIVLQVPGADFASQLVVEEQIRQQIGVTA